MKVKNAWVWTSQVKILNRKLEGLVKQYIGQTYTDSVKKSVYAIVKDFVLKERLADDTAFLIKLDKTITSGTLIVQIFKGIQIVV